MSKIAIFLRFSDGNFTGPYTTTARLFFFVRKGGRGRERGREIYIERERERESDEG